ncbi:cytidyltransferase-related domain protein [Novosphingobium sp. Rr 2-17]|uniref:D-glycero-beta-D-manno-heptose 1-phosphate adenylyltransferase n=1 Tax=Novosphingobium sp. Rr 2-17 TaxID=555793 RepID=UPI000269ABCE|nr:D-glycero-beta-D-manno-heptose 1-phosphate adenylyltransferase [Novosphingobium sp. Rr 2-17]EIZ77183.1 cytidyltransferase-related domain protein [Novosphingobium sp. Rr 2-17]
MSWDAPSPNRPHILVVGDAMIDRYIIGETYRISPEAPVPVVRAGREEMRAGGSANVAANVAALGPRCSLLTICGDDPAGEDLARLMSMHGVALDCVVERGQRTTEKTRLISGVQQIARIDQDGAAGDASRAELARRFEALLDGVRAVIFSDYDKGVLADLPALIAIARRHGVPTFVDPKAPDPSRYAGAFLLKPNVREFHALFGACPEEQIAERARLALAELDLDYLVVTRGAKGIMMVTRTGEVVDHPTEALEVFDVTGAGDTIIAALVVAIAEGLPIAAAIDQANLAASIAVSRPGTYVVTRSDLEERLHRRSHATSKLVPLPMLLGKLGHARADGARIVFTNGCFDVLHAGHVRLLDLARRQGDVLIVGLNSDASVRRLKGAPRPVNGVDDRAEVLSGLAAVDHVVLFEEDTPLDLIRAIRPDILVKGGDYTADTIVGADIVREGGGQVVVAPLLAGRSTTSILGALHTR